MPQPKRYDWVDPRSIALFAAVVLGIDLAWAVVGLGLEIVYGARLSIETTPPTQWTPIQWVKWAHVSAGLLTLVGGIVLCRWILRVSKNASALKGRPLKNSPWFAALWWYFIPFMSLFKPPESIGEIWDASALDPKQRRQGQGLIASWWICYLASNGLAYFQAITHAQGAVAVVTWAFSIASCTGFLAIVLRVTAMQVEKRELSVFSDAEPPVSVLERMTW